MPTRTTAILLFALTGMTGLTGCAPRQAPAEADLNATDAASRIPALVQAGQSEDPKHVADLVHALSDEDSAVRLFAIQSLNQRFSQTLGYRYYEAADQRLAAIERWRRWLSENQGIDLAAYDQDDPPSCQ